MSQHMGHNQFILDEAVPFQQEGVTRIGIDHQFVDSAEIQIILQFHFVEGLTKTPVGKSCRHSVRPEGVDHVRRANLISHRIKIKSESLCDLRDLSDRPFQFFHFIHRSPSLLPPVLSLQHTSRLAKGCYGPCPSHGLISI